MQMLMALLELRMEMLLEFPWKMAFDMSHLQD